MCFPIGVKGDETEGSSDVQRCAHFLGCIVKINFPLRVPDPIIDWSIQPWMNGELVLRFRHDGLLREIKVLLCVVP